MSSLLTFGILQQTQMITDGLALWVDASIPSSYPGTGNTWYDLSGNSRNFTLYNSPTYSTNNGGILQFNGTTQYAEMTNMNYTTNTFTLMTGVRYAGSPRGRIVNGRYTNNIYGNHGDRSARYYAQSWVYQGGSTNDLNWRIHAFTENYPSDLRSYYRDNVALAVNSTAGTAGFNGLTIARFAGNASEWSNCEVAFIVVYDRILSTAELTHNYNYFASRF